MENNFDLQEYRKNLVLKSSEEWRRDTFLPFNIRKKILLLSDDLRLPSGVGTMSKEIVLKTIHRYNWVQVGGAIKHPEKGKIVDMSKEMDRLFGIGENYMRIYPYDGYGDPDLVRYMINAEKVHAIIHFTDPRFWIWLYQMEHEIRQYIPLSFYAIWDDVPIPMYNQDYYESCDSVGCISKQTYNIVKQSRKRLPLESWALRYLPHGVDHINFKPLGLSSPEESFEIKDKKTETVKITNEYEELRDFRKKIFKERDFDFIVFYNNRNIRRKMPGDVILAFKCFTDMLTEEQRKKVALVMHTQPIDENGTDLIAVKRAVAPDINLIFSNDRLEPKYLNYLYNVCDVTINMASNEGFGLSTCESLMVGKPIIATVTGGLQDQMGFVDENGEYIDPDKHFNSEWGSNHDGKYKKHGSWVRPLFPTNRALVGSPPTPYIFDDRCDWYDAAVAIKYWYDVPKEERDKRGLEGREYLIKCGMTSEMMGKNFMDFIDITFENFKSRKRFDIFEIKPVDDKIKFVAESFGISDFQKEFATKWEETK